MGREAAARLACAAEQTTQHPCDAGDIWCFGGAEARRKSGDRVIIYHEM